MLAYDPEDRLSISDIRKHPWMQEEVATPEGVKQFLDEVDRNIHASRI